MGKKNADKMLKEGYKATAQDALEMGLISEVVSHEQLLSRAQVGLQLKRNLQLTTCQELGEEWARAGRQRRLRGGASVEEYTRVNIEESRALAEVFVSEKFLRCDSKIGLDTVEMGKVINQVSDGKLVLQIFRTIDLGLTLGFWVFVVLKLL